MIILEGIMHRKVKWWITLIVVIMLVVIAAVAISAEAANNWILGGEVVRYEPFCSAASTTPTCPGVPCRCTRCGCVWAPCVPPSPPLWSEIIMRPAGRSMSYSCPRFGFKYSGTGQPAPKRKILGFGSDAYSLLKAGLGR